MPTAMPSAPRMSATGILARKDHGFTGSTVVGVHVLRDVRTEQDFAGQGGEPAFDVPRRRGLSAGKHRPEIALLVDEQVLVGQRNQGTENGLVAMGMELHGLADDVGDLVVLAVIDLEEGVENAALNGLQSVVDFRNSPVFLRRRWRIRGSTGRIGVSTSAKIRPL